MQELSGIDRLRLQGIVRFARIELSVQCVLEGTAPGKVFVDDREAPRSFLVRTPECNVVGGDVLDERFLDGLKGEIGYYDSLLCDGGEWNDVVARLHPNPGTRSYVRKWYRWDRTSDLPLGEDGGRVEYIHPKDLGNLRYENAGMVLDWVNIAHLEDLQDVCLAAVVVEDGRIASCACLDCCSFPQVEIGIKTVADRRRKGYGLRATASLVRRLAERGIVDINWHCMSTNAGSAKIAERCGFVERREYPIHFPYPPVENRSDLSPAEWTSLAGHFERLGGTSADQFWQAARCWAKADDRNRAAQCVARLVAQDQTWFLEHLEECDEFASFSQDEGWNTLIAQAKRKAS